MSSVTENGQNATTNQTENGQKTNDKEYNFAQIRQQLEKERSEKNALMQELEKTRSLAQQRLTPQEEEDVDDEPYVDHKRLKKELVKVVQKTSSDTDSKIQQAVNKALSEERQKSWLKNNPDFYEIMNHAQAFADKDPELAETILEMPDSFERQKLVYKSIKAMGLHKPPEVKSGIQDKIEANRRSPYYQPSGVASPGYGIANGGKDYSEPEGKNAYAKMKELQKRMRM